MPLVIAAVLLATTAVPQADPDDAAPASSSSVPPSGDRDESSARRSPKARAAKERDDDDDRPHGVAAPKAGKSDEDEDEDRAQPSSSIVVTAHRLDAARTRVNVALGATVYSLTNDAIENRPGGETGSVSDILTQAPGVTLSGRTLNIRGSAANQVRINNVIIPEAVTDPADQISSRLAQTTELIAGTLPAQFGFAPAGVISVTTKNGLYEHGGQAELFAGSDGMVEPAFEWAGSASNTSLFASGELEHDRSIIGDADGNGGQDKRTAISGLGFADHVINDGNRLSFVFGGSDERHRVGTTSLGSGTETSRNAYGVATYQHSGNGFTLQASVFAGAGSDASDLVERTGERRTSWGTQIDASETVNDSNNVHFGLLASHSIARELDRSGATGDRERTALAMYAQDEWKLGPSLTFNPGARLEWLRGLTATAHLEPRATLVWSGSTGLTAHIGYARYASAAPLESEQRSARLPDERDDYADAGVQQRLGDLTVGVDGYWRSASNYVSEHRDLGSAVPVAFEFKHALIRGIELSATYAHRATTAWANISLSRAQARTIAGGEAIVAASSISGASQGYVRLGSDRPVTGSAGITHRLGRLSLSADAQVSSGAPLTRTDADPNGGRHSAYALIGLAAVYHTRIGGRPSDLRIDLTNLTNAHYLTNDASTLEGDWSRRGRGRAITIGIEQGF